MTNFYIYNIAIYDQFIHTHYMLFNWGNKLWIEPKAKLEGSEESLGN